jgi:hypothetical protein
MLKKPTYSQFENVTSKKESRDFVYLFNIIKSNHKILFVKI